MVMAGSPAATSTMIGENTGGGAISPITVIGRVSTAVLMIVLPPSPGLPSAAVKVTEAGPA